MRIQKISIAFLALAIAVTSCMKDDFSDYTKSELTNESGSTISLVTGRADGVISLSVDAPEQVRTGVWIDLDGNGKRAENGTEDVKVFNAYREYTLAAGVKSVSIHGDITYLAAASNELTAINVSANPHLTTLNVPLNNLSALDLSKNSALMRLDCSGNNLSSLDLSQNRSLVSLWVFDNELASLNVSDNAELAFLDCSGNKLNTLDVSKNREMMRLLAYNNRLTTLDISQNSKLNHLWLFGNPLSNKETGRIITTLRSVIGGDLWLTDEPLDEALTQAVAAKGWTLQ